MIIWIVQTQRTRRSMPEARIFKTWAAGIRYINKLQPGHYMKPILFRADTRKNDDHSVRRD